MKNLCFYYQEYKAAQKGEVLNWKTSSLHYCEVQVGDMPIERLDEFLVENILRSVLNSVTSAEHNTQKKKSNCVYALVKWEIVNHFASNLDFDIKYSVRHLLQSAIEDSLSQNKKQQSIP